MIASNRLPVSLSIDENGWKASRSSGGLASALGGIASTTELTWVGWPGCVVPEEYRSEIGAWMKDQDLVPVYVDEAEEAAYYHGISNQVLWPLFHYFPNKVSYSPKDWDHYVAVNERFAQHLIEACPAGARVWIHDFHLMLVPRILHAARPDLEIGFFLHIPFPSSEIYRLLPVREELLRGLLGSTYIGFHTHDYARHFRSSCVRVLGADAEHDSVQFEGRRIGVGAHPIGIDVRAFDDALTADNTRNVYADLDERYRGRRLFLGIERLDYTKGVMLKLRAFELLLERRPELASEVTMLQVIVPSRLDNPDYAALKREIDEFVGRVNGRFGGPGRTPVEYLHRSIDQSTLVSLYRRADACLVTPIRDGMNLVAQEFVLCQGEFGPGRPWNGSLVLSEFAGAAKVLTRALLVNPWNVEQIADVMETAVSMPREERQERMSTMVQQVRQLECTGWSNHFLNRMSSAASRCEVAEHSKNVRMRSVHEEELCGRLASASSRVLFLDYDGTLRELQPTPEEAAPTHEILGLLQDLSELPDTEVHIVSGRHRENLQRWFGHLSVGLSAEHGFAWRPIGGHWCEHDNVDMTWLTTVREQLESVCREVPGTMVELKPSAIAWHYRNTDPEYGPWRARELVSQLEQDLAHVPVEIIHGHRVIEVRAVGIHKGRYVEQILLAAAPDVATLCLGDDRTDRDMYRALPESGEAIHVGAPIDEVEHWLESPRRVRTLLSRLKDEIQAESRPIT